MDDWRVIEIAEVAIRALVEEQREHLERGRVERTFTTDLAAQLRSRFRGFEVDAFYNKHGRLAKRLNGRLVELDIAIHRRGTDEHNLLAIELETSNTPTRDDVWKIIELTKQTVDGYNYRLGLFLAVGVARRAGEIVALEWYRNGRSTS